MLKLSHSCCCLFSLIPSILWEGKICLNKVLLSCACCQSRNLFSLLKILPKLCPLQLSLNWGQFYHGIFENLDRKINEIKKKKKTVKQYALIIMLYIDNRVKQKIVQSTWNHQKNTKIKRDMQTVMTTTKLRDKNHCPIEGLLLKKTLKSKRKVFDTKLQLVIHDTSTISQTKKKK